jgi:hypothetical protein
MSVVNISKDLDNPTFIPDIWRETIHKIVDAFSDGDYSLSTGISNALPISQSTALELEESIAAYGASLITLPEKTWDSSQCQWAGDFWDVFIDLFTVEEGRSDLVLQLRVYEKDHDYLFKVYMIYVP